MIAATKYCFIGVRSSLLQTFNSRTRDWTHRSSLISKKEAPAGYRGWQLRNREIEVSAYFRGCVCTACWWCQKHPPSPTAAMVAMIAKVNNVRIIKSPFLRTNIRLFSTWTCDFSDTTQTKRNGPRRFSTLRPFLGNVDNSAVLKAARRGYPDTGCPEIK